MGTGTFSMRSRLVAARGIQVEVGGASRTRLQLTWPPGGASACSRQALRETETAVGWLVDASIIAQMSVRLCRSDVGENMSRHLRELEEELSARAQVEFGAALDEGPEQH